MPERAVEAKVFHFFYAPLTHIDSRTIRAFDYPSFYFQLRDIAVEENPFLNPRECRLHCDIPMYDHVDVDMLIELP